MDVENIEYVESSLQRLHLFSSIETRLSDHDNQIFTVNFHILTCKMSKHRMFSIIQASVQFILVNDIHLLKF